MLRVIDNKDALSILRVLGMTYFESGNSLELVDIKKCIRFLIALCAALTIFKTDRGRANRKSETVGFTVVKEILDVFGNDANYALDELIDNVRPDTIFLGFLEGVAFTGAGDIAADLETEPHIRVCSLYTAIEFLRNLGLTFFLLGEPDEKVNFHKAIKVFIQVCAAISIYKTSHEHTSTDAESIGFTILRTIVMALVTDTADLSLMTRIDGEVLGMSILYGFFEGINFGCAQETGADFPPLVVPSYTDPEDFRYSANSWNYQQWIALILPRLVNPTGNDANADHAAICDLITNVGFRDCHFYGLNSRVAGNLCEFNVPAPFLLAISNHSFPLSALYLKAVSTCGFVNWGSARDHLKRFCINCYFQYSPTMHLYPIIRKETISFETAITLFTSIKPINHSFPDPTMASMLMAVLYRGPFPAKVEMALKLLEEHPPLAHIPDSFGVTPLALVCSGKMGFDYSSCDAKMFPVIDVLLEYAGSSTLNIPLRIQDRQKDLLPLHMFLMWKFGEEYYGNQAEKQHAYLVGQMVLRYPDGLKYEDPDSGICAAHCAVLGRNYKSARVIFSKAPEFTLAKLTTNDYYLPGSGNMTPLAIAATFGDAQMIRSLCKLSPQSARVSTHVVPSIYNRYIEEYILPLVQAVRAFNPESCRVLIDTFPLAVKHISFFTGNTIVHEAADALAKSQLPFHGTDANDSTYAPYYDVLKLMTKCNPAAVFMINKAGMTPLQLFKSVYTRGPAPVIDRIFADAAVVAPRANAVVEMKTDE